MGVTTSLTLQTRNNMEGHWQDVNVSGCQEVPDVTKCCNMSKEVVRCHIYTHTLEYLTARDACICRQTCQTWAEHACTCMDLQPPGR